MKRIIYAVTAVFMTLSLSSFYYEAECDSYVTQVPQTAVFASMETTAVNYKELTAEKTTLHPNYTNEDVVAVAQTLWGEARGCSLEDQKNVVRTICNRCDDSRFPDTPYEVVTQAYQYAGYSPNNPIDPALTDIAVSVLEDWSLIKQGAPNIEWTDYLWFTGNGICNTFRSTY